ncbi:MAG: hypothetical protein KGZ35_05380 [Truepera sp.]|nr:hypothetical protein [Truepera sp.]
MPDAAKRRARRRLMIVVYPVLWLLTLIGVRSADPQLFGIPIWYLWAGLIMLLLVPINAYFVRYCWPEPSDSKNDFEAQDG